MKVDITDAQVDDLSGIAVVLVDTWRATFAGLLPGSFLSGLNVEQQLRRHQNVFGQPGVNYQVARADGQVVGFASGGPSRHDAFPDTNELYALYLLPAWQRRGIGRQLFHRLATQLQAPGRQGLLALVLANNPNQGFYQQAGGLRHGAQDIELGGHTVAQHAYIWTQTLKASISTRT